MKGAPLRRTFALALVLFVAVSALAGAGLLHGADLRTLRAAQAALPGFFHPLGEVFSEAGDAGPATFALVLLCGVLFFAGRRKLALRLAAAYAVLSLAEVVIKILLPVPAITDAVRLDAGSILEPAFFHPYPSGHLFRSVLVLGALFVLLPNVLVRAAVLVLLILMAITRVYLGVHWPSDLVGGALLGILGLAWAFGGRQEKVKR